MYEPVQYAFRARTERGVNTYSSPKPLPFFRNYPLIERNMKMKQEPGKVKIDWTPEKTKRAQILLMDYFNRVESYSGESVQQCDSSIIEAPVVLSDIADALFEDVEIDYD